ncbi:hypothetical protein J3R30DRAFT_3301437, partial [Lentinula aciculospora]
HQEEKISILAVYAPNSDTAANAQSWERIQEFYTWNPRIRQPDFMVGDCNMVEEPLDRLPTREEPANVATAFDYFKRTLRLEDSWRNENPMTLAYTYHQKRNAGCWDISHSRLDCIYMTSNNIQNTYEWRIEQTGVYTDHSLVSVCYICEEAPYIGRGQWMFPTYMLYDKKVLAFIESEREAPESNLASTLEREEWNPLENC